MGAARHDWITFLSDYGLEDVFVGVCKGAMARIAPHARVLDVCHLVAPQDVTAGATALAAAMPYLPVGVHLALVDPQQDPPARGVAVTTGDGSVFVGPDNGLMSMAYESRGGATAAVEVANRDLWLDTVHATFRGRDMFAPVAAHLAADSDLADVGPSVSVDDLVTISLTEAVVDDDHVHAEIRSVDHFGNLSLNVARTDLEAAGITLGDTVEVRCNGRSMTIPFLHTFAEVQPGRLTLCEDSFRAVQLAVNAGAASSELRVHRGDAVVIARLPQQAAGRAPTL